MKVGGLLASTGATVLLCLCTAPAVAAPSFSSVSVGVGDDPSAVASGDLDGDGHVDLVVVNRGADSVSVLLGNGDGTFESPVSYAVGDGPVGLTVGNIDSGGVLDVAVANEADDTVSVLLGVGDGTFGAASSLALGGGLGPVSVSIGDLMDPSLGFQDGIGDLAVATPGSNDVTLLFNDGAGGVASTYSVAPIGGTPVAAQVLPNANSSVAPDLLIASEGSNQLEVIRSAGGFNCVTFVPFFYPVESEPPDSCPDSPTGYVSRSFDENFGPLQPTGLARIVLDPNSPAQTFALLQPDRLSIFTAQGFNFNNGTPPAIDMVRTVSLPGSPTSVASGDFDGKSKRDLAVAYSDLDQVSLLLSKPGGDFDRVDVNGPTAGGGIVAGDFDENGHPEFAASDGPGDVLSVFADRWPLATTGAVSDITKTTASFAGSGDSQGLGGTSRFLVFGVGHHYAEASEPLPLSAPAGSVPISGAIEDLEPGRTYRYQLAVTNEVGTTYGSQGTFTTPPATPTGPVPGPPVPGSDPGLAAYGCAGPRLNSFARRVRAGQTVALTGSDLGVFGSVRFGAIDAEVQSWTAGRILVTVPAGVRGSVPVTADCGARSNTIRVRVTATRRAPNNRFTLTARSVKGTKLTLTVRVPGRGRIVAQGRRLRQASKRTAGRGSVKLRLRLTQSGRRALERTGNGRLSVRVRVRYRPSGGNSRTATTTVTFKTAGSR